MVEELKLAIKIDDATVEQSLLKQFANAQKMADKVVLDFKNVNFDDKQIEAKFKEMQKKAGQNPIDLSISGNTLDMLGQIDKRLTEIFSIGKGKSFIDSSSTVADIGKIENKINELNKKYEEAQKKLSSIGSGNISGKDVNLVDNKEFQKLSQEVSELKNQFDDLKTHMQLLDDYTVPTDRFFKLQSQVETTTVKVSDLVEEFTKLSNAQKALSSTPQESNISLGSTSLINDQNNYQKELSETKKLTDDNVSSMFEFIKLCQEQAKALGETNEELKERAAYFKDEKISGGVSIGTHYVGNHDNSDINGANSDLHSHFSKYASFSENDLFNLKDTIKNFMVMGTDELTHFDTSGLSNDLLEQIWLRYDTAIKELNQQYFDNLNIKNNLKFTDIEDIPERILDKAFEFAENQSNIDYDYDKYDVFYNNQIEKIRQKLLEGASLNDITNSISDDIKSFDINGVESEIKTFQEKFTEGIRGYLTNILLENDIFNPDKMLGMQDYNIARNNSLKSVLEELNVDPDRLKTIDISNLEEGYSSLLKILGLVVDKQKEVVSATTTDQTKDAFPKISENLEQVAQSEQKVQQEAVATDKALDNITFTPNTEGFDEVLSKLDLTKSKLSEITKISIQGHRNADGKFDTSYILRDKNGSTETYGESSKSEKGQLLTHNYVQYDANAQLRQEQQETKRIIEENIRLNKNYYDSKAKDETEYQKLRAKYIAEGLRQEQQVYQEYNKSWEEAINYNNSLDNSLKNTETVLDGLATPKTLENDFLKLIDDSTILEHRLKNCEITLKEYNSLINSKVGDYNKKVSIQQNRDLESYNAQVNEKNTKKLEREKQIWNELMTSLDRYATLQKRIASNNALSTDNKEAAKLLKYIYELQRSDVLPSEKLNASNEKLQQIKQTVTDLKAKLKESTLDSLQSSIDKYQKIYNQRSTYSSDFTPSEQYTKNLTELNTAIGNLVEYKNTLKNVSEVTVEQETHLKGLVAACEKASDSFKSLSASEKGASQIAVDKLVQRINKDLDECTNYSKEAKLGLRALRDELESTNPRNLKEITSEIINIENAEIKAGRAGRSFFDTLKNSGFHQLAAQMAGMFGFYDVINLGKEGFNVVRELNTALTEMRKVSDESLQSLTNYQNTTFDTADAVGTTAKQIQASTADYMRLGESLDGAAESAKTANVLLNVSEFDNIEDATKSLVAMGQAYKDLDKMTIVDKLNEVGNNYAISTDELATALQKSAATLSLMGNTIDEAASLVTTANATIQDADSVSAGLRTISLRLVGTKEAEEELSAMNEEVDAFVKATNSKKQQIIKDYTAVASNNYQGFDILDSNGNYKNTYQVLLGIAKVYKEIQEQDKKLGTNHATALIEELAGKNRSNIASAILKDPTQLEAVKKSSEEALGSAKNELNSYLDSIDGKMAQLENRAQEFWFKVIDSETIKNGINLLSTLLKGTTDFVDTVGLLPTLAPAIAAAFSFKNVG